VLSFGSILDRRVDLGSAPLRAAKSARTKDVHVDQLTQRFPNLWHVTFAGGWEGIQRHGFLRTIDVASESSGKLRTEITRVETADGTQVMLRDQLRTRADPTRSLDDITPSEWWQLVNSRVYFFCRQRDVNTLVESYIGRRLPQEVIKLRAKPVLEVVADEIEVTTVNVGVFPRTRAPSRGRSSFVPLADYPVADAAKIREITVAARVPIASSAITSVARYEVDGHRSRVFP
jgi:hypothetical protein